VTNFPASANLQQKNITVTTLPSVSVPVNMFSPSAGLWMTDLNGNSSTEGLINVFTGSPETFKLSIPVAATPIMLIGPGVIGQRNYAITQGAVANGVTCNNSPTTGPPGEADGIEISNNTVSSHIPLGKCPVYALQSPDGKRLFVLNRGSDTVTVINSQNNTLNACTPFVDQTGRTVTCHPTLPLSTTAGLTGANVPAVAGPVYAEYNTTTNQLIVANYDGDTVNVIDVSLDEFGNDSSTFGTTFTIPVGANPASVTALYDGTRAYTANQTDRTVAVVNLTSHTVEKTIAVTGHPRTVASTQNSLYGKVYVASPDTPYLTILRTDQDIVDTTVLVQGNIMDVRATTQNGVSGNPINTSRKPGYGQPCYLPGAAAAASYATCTTLPMP
jgi:YVTN family beta-propeller protein